MLFFVSFSATWSVIPSRPNKTLAIKPEITAENMLSDLLLVWMGSFEIVFKRKVCQVNF